MSLNSFQLDIEWNKYKAKVQARTRNHPGEVKILYECPHRKREKINHHPDYLVWDEIERLCRGCHNKIPRQERPPMWAPGARRVNIWKGGLTTKQRVERSEQRLFAPKIKMTESVEKAAAMSVSEILKMGTTKLPEVK
jgi:integrase